MKSLSVLIVMFSLSAFAERVEDKSFVVHGDPSSIGDSTHRSFAIPHSRKLIVDLVDNPGDMRFNQMTVSVFCPALKRDVVIARNATVCGLTSVDYKTDDSITVHLTKYNAATGNCAGEAYTEEYSLLGKCKLPKKRDTQNAREGLDGDADVFYPPQ